MVKNSDIVYVFMPLENVLCFDSSINSLVVDEQDIVRAAADTFQEWKVDRTCASRISDVRGMYNIRLIITSHWFGRFGIEHLRSYLEENKVKVELAGILRPQFDVYFIDEIDRKVYEIQMYIEKYKEHIQRWIIVDTDNLTPYLSEHYHDRFVKVGKKGLRHKMAMRNIKKAIHEVLKK